MFAKAFVPVLLSALAVSAVPYRRDLIDDITSDWGDATSDVASGWSAATSDIASDFGVASSGFNSAEASATASRILASVTSEIGTATSQVYAFETTVNGHPLVEVTSVGGSAITLATSSGMVTSFDGHQFTVMTAVPSSTANAAIGVHPISVSRPMLVGVATVLGSIFAGAIAVL